MLIRVSITNFKSFNEETEFNMLASSDQRTHKEHVYSQHGVDLLKTAAIYGANGAGKSNLVKAIAALQNIVLEGDAGLLTNLDMFKLNGLVEKSPIELEIEFVSKEKAYLFGVIIRDQIFVEEWLYESGLGVDSDVLLFHRRSDNKKTRIEFSNKYISSDKDRFRLSFLEDELIKSNMLLFKELNLLKDGFQEVKEAYSWFDTNTFIIFPHSKLPLVSQLSQFNSFRIFANSVINTLQTGVAQIGINELPLDDIIGSEKSDMHNLIIKNSKKGKDFTPFTYENKSGRAEEMVAFMKNDRPMVNKLILKHRNKKADLVEFDMDEESDGTNRLLEFTVAFFSAIYYDMTVVIDEIDQSIHPALLKELVRKFVGDPNTKGQLIFTTHESNLLDQNIFRRDEIWFAQKHEGATKLYPLSDFDIRFDLDIRKGYLNGRFGAIPFLGNLADLNWDQYAEA